MRLALPESGGRHQGVARLRESEWRELVESGRAAFGEISPHTSRSRKAVHPILLCPEPRANGDETGSPDRPRSLADT